MCDTENSNLPKYSLEIASIALFVQQSGVTAVPSFIFTGLATFLSYLLFESFNYSYYILYKAIFFNKREHRNTTNYFIISIWGAIIFS